MKRLLLIWLLTFTFQSASSQYNFRRFSVGFGGGFSEPYSDVTNNKQTPGFMLSYDTYLTPFIYGGLEAQAGTLKGGDRLTNAHRREFKNNYVTGLVTVKLALGEFLNYRRPGMLNKIKGLYVGSGLGMIRNKLIYVTRIKDDGSYYRFPGTKNSFNLVLPLMTGLTFNFEDGWGETRYIVGLGYQMNVTFGEGMDGFNDPPAKFENNNNDMYSLATLSLKYCFGRHGVFYKPFRYK